ncbi:unnamed protein product [Clavelina lepadiformis]|uniref:Uncharacterized protein n=1 Tax=Clavelina lepadiformis TaxID=159417 RepID=A0ABP0G113_CLALP
MLFIRATKRLLLVAAGGTMCAHFSMTLYTQYHLRHGFKSIFENQFQPVSGTTEERITKARQPIVEAVQALFEMTHKDTSNILALFSDDVVYEDPFVRCKGKAEFFKCFSLLPWCWEFSTTDQFEVTHHKDYIQIAQERSIKFFNRKAFQRSSVLLISLDLVDGQEKIKSVEDQWSGHPILSPDNSPRIGWLAVVFRKLNAKRIILSYGIQMNIYSYFQNSKQNDLDDTTVQLVEQTMTSHRGD